MIYSDEYQSDINGAVLLRADVSAYTCVFQTINWLVKEFQVEFAFTKIRELNFK